MVQSFGESFWDERYSGSEAVWSGQPNPQLVSEISGMPPGRALDVGCGEGADSMWLARQGWQVTAVDFSNVALRRARQHSSSQAFPGSIAWEHRNLLQWTPPASSFDLVTAQFIHLPSEDREPLFLRLATSVARGGSLLIVGHSAADIQAGARRPQGDGLYFSAIDIAASLPQDMWRICVAEARPRGGLDADGHSITIHDEVLRAVRLA
ncbi:SAM-dependent methyltransferase [Arthrobacter stackebrandtii]|uniref:SAM-dependent methyltransferase n=1 Tax=Arthrobacter stackebrandtii TaxID=272161 RepID=A0ABS4Z0U4_9MICC|nr:class I SAM-dependent methyltransferase [Arthrobacter stackebrandtii]MBP2413863.1 SAM-dependent methyltransferase [Arthrobacter stackebrandtii]PYH00539.1 SAM-dependent methyltransferase [Arthrobacter stackebrandtii]